MESGKLGRFLQLKISGKENDAHKAPFSKDELLFN